MYKTALTALAELARRTILTSTGKLSERDDGYGGNLGKEDR
jgi:hypothetical protein